MKCFQDKRKKPFEQARNIHTRILTKNVTAQKAGVFAEIVFALSRINSVNLGILLLSSNRSLT